MTYSVWDHGRRRYTYYRTQEENGDIHAPKPRHTKNMQLGMSPEEAAWPLPKNAILVGSGKYPKGRIAYPGGGPGLGFFPDLTISSAVIYGAIGWIAWKIWKGR